MRLKDTFTGLNVGEVQTKELQMEGKVHRSQCKRQAPRVDTLNKKKQLIQEQQYSCTAL